MDKDKSADCKICNKRLANCKSMGGHMRSHSAKQKIPLKPQPSLPQPPPPIPDTLPKSQLPYNSFNKKNDMQTFGSLNCGIVCCLPTSGFGFQKKRNETESPRILTRRRSKRQRRFFMKQLMVEPPAPQLDLVSLDNETPTDEVVANILVMLSKDKWPSEEIEAVEVMEAEEQKEEEGAEGDDNGKLGLADSEAKYNCETCNKVFPSYQSVNGHGAYHHKNKTIKIEPGDEEYDYEDDDDDEFEYEEEEEDDDDDDEETRGQNGRVLLKNSLSDLWKKVCVWSRSWWP